VPKVNQECQKSLDSVLLALLMKKSTVLSEEII